MCTANNCTSKRCTSHEIIHATTVAHFWTSFTLYTSFLPQNIFDRIDYFCLLINPQNLILFQIKWDICTNETSRSQVITFQIIQFHIILISSNLKKKLYFKSILENCFRTNIAKHVRKHLTKYNCHYVNVKIRFQTIIKIQV